MKDFMLIFRADFSVMATRTPDEQKATTQRYMDWIANIAGQDKLIDRGNRLEPTGKVVAAGNVITNGPYTEVKEFIGGYTMIRAESYDDAVKLVSGSPVFEIGGKVEIREIGKIG